MSTGSVLTAELKEDIGCSGDPKQNNDPDTPLEDIVIGKQFKPGMAANIMEKINSNTTVNAHHVNPMVMAQRAEDVG